MGETGSRIGWNTLVSFGSSIGRRVVKLVGSIVFANLAGAAALGVLYVFMSLYRIGRRLTTLGMGPTVVTQVSEARTHGETDTIGNIVASALAIRIVPLVILSFGGYIFADAIDSYVGIEDAWLYLLIAVGTTILFSTGRAVLSGFKRVDLSGALDISRDLGTTALQIGLVILGFKEFGLVVGFVGGMVFVTVISLLLLFPRVDGLVPSVERAGEMVQFAKFAFLDTLVGGEQLWLDVILLGLFVGTAVTQAQIGIYGIAYSISMLGFALSTAIGRAILPEIRDFDTAGSDRIRNKTVRESLRYATVLSIPLAFGAFAIGDIVLRDVFGFASGQTPLVALTIGAVAFSAYQPLHQVFYGLNRPQWAFSISLATATLNTVLNLALIPMFGTVGVAISTALSMYLALGVGYGLIRHVGIANVIPFRSWVIQFSAAALMTVAVIGLDSLLRVRSQVVTALLICVGGLVYSSILFVGEQSIRQRVLQALC